MTWWQAILVVWAVALALAVVVGVYWGTKTQYIEKYNETRPRTIFEQKESSGQAKQPDSSISQVR